MYSVELLIANRKVDFLPRFISGALIFTSFIGVVVHVVQVSELSSRCYEQEMSSMEERTGGGCWPLKLHIKICPVLGLKIPRAPFPIPPKSNHDTATPFPDPNQTLFPGRSLIPTNNQTLFPRLSTWPKSYTARWSFAIE